MDADDDGDTWLRCRKLQNPFATSGERHYCIKSADKGWRVAEIYLQSCNQSRGVAEAMHFLIKQHNPEVRLDWN